MNLHTPPHAPSLSSTSATTLRRSLTVGVAALAVTAFSGTFAAAAGVNPVSGHSTVTSAGGAPSTPPSITPTPGNPDDPMPADAQWVSATGAPVVAGLSAAPLRVVPVSTSAELTTALAKAHAGDRIELATGTYNGPFTISVSGSAAHPVVVAPVTGAAVTLKTPNLKYPACGATGPDENKTVSFVQGASHWVLTGLTIQGGLRLSSQGADGTQNWQKAMIDRHNWAARRGVPGADFPANVSATRTLASWFSTLTGQTVKPTEDVQLLSNTFTGKGIFGRFAQYGVIAGNTVTSIACGTGPAIWLANYSHGNLIADNDVSHVATSTASHYMQEGIRLGNGSDYNVVAGNRVHDLDAGGRAFTTDQDSSYNLFTTNVADNVTIGYNEEQSGWGNTWTLNVANRASNAAFSFRMEDVRLTAPSKDTSSYYTTVTCNVSTNSATDLQIGAMAGGTFRGNSFGKITLSKPLAGYWAAQGNRWNDSAAVPQSGSAPAATGC